MRFSRLLPLTLVSLLAAGAASADPTPVPMPPPIAAPQDIAYPGTIQLHVDATDTAHGIFRMQEHIPVAAAGPMTLLFPHWLPGWHSAGGEIEKFAGLTITANGQTIPWRRDEIDVTAFHIDVPAGVQTLDLAFNFLSATNDGQGPIVATRVATEVEWNNELLYPAGYFASRIMVEPHLKLPAGWTYASALGSGTSTDAPIQFPAIDVATLIDSPLDAGRFANRIDLDPHGRSPVFLTVFGDRADQVVAAPEQIAPHRRLVQQADRLFGARHFDHYDFLLTLSDRLQDNGLEHHRSSENGLGTGYFTEWSDYLYERDLLPHEMTHSWNGKYRRPADLWTPNFNVPMRNSLLWAYEGQTQYWGQVLAARSGLFTKQQAMDSLALTAAIYGPGRPGRTWRGVEDTTNDPVIANRPPQAWRSYQRSEDYYEEGQLVWLDADTLIRERTNNRKSLDDFARAFFGGHDGDWSVNTYNFDDVVAALNGVTPYDWATFLHTRIDTVRPEQPFDGLSRAGYRLVFTEERGDWMKSYETERKRAVFLYALGFTLGDGGAVAEVLWDSLAFNAGMTTGDTLVAVNGAAYDADGLRRAITDAKTGHAPIELLMKNGDEYRTVSLDYHGGLRYPHLERIPGAPDRLSQILAPR